jgi:hypothetical protein
MPEATTDVSSAATTMAAIPFDTARCLRYELHRFGLRGAWTAVQAP